MWGTCVAARVKPIVGHQCLCVHLHVCIYIIDLDINIDLDLDMYIYVCVYLHIYLKIHIYIYHKYATCRLKCNMFGLCRGTWEGVLRHDGQLQGFAAHCGRVRTGTFI